MKRKTFDLIEISLIIGIVIFLNIIGSRYFFRLDLTEDQHFSLSASTKEMLKSSNKKVYVEVYLDGELSPDYQRLKNAIKEKLEEFSIYSEGNLQFRFTNPNAIEDEKIRNQYAAQLVQKGVEYRYERIEKDGAQVEQLIFPSALISVGATTIPIMFLKGNKTAPIEEQLNQSVEVVEYQLMAGMRKLYTQINDYVGFIEGHGEYNAAEVADFSAALSDFYHVHRLSLSDSISLDKYKLLIIARPTQSFNEQEKFLLDQYVVKGGKLLVMTDALNIHVDSLLNGYTYALPYELKLSDLFFKWGLRCNTNLVKDLNCGVLKVAVAANQPMQMVNWNFHPIVYQFGKHVSVRNLDAILFKYPSSIDTVKASGIQKTPLLFTSANTKIIEAPSKIDLNDTRKTDEPKTFNQGVQVLAYLLEGQFQSLYTHRPSPIAGRAVVPRAQSSKIIFISDADIAKNEIDLRSGRPIPLGFDVNTQYVFSNKEFLTNAVDYLMGQKIVELRSKEIQLRPLDKVRVKEEKLKWQMINLILPPVLLIIFGLVRLYWRKRKYEQLVK